MLTLGTEFASKYIQHGKSEFCLLVIVGLAALSYRYFETPFLNLKRSLEIVHSRPV